MNDSTDLRSLFASYVSGEITAPQLATLEAALRDDAGLRKEFIEYLNIDSALGELAALTGAEIAAIEQAAATIPMSETAPRRDARSRRGFRRVLTIATAAATLLLATSLWFGKRDRSMLIPVATLVNDVDAVLSRDGQDWRENAIPVGRYSLHRGLLNLRFGGGVMVYVEAPAQFEAVDEKRLLLQAGRLSANVPPAGVGFTVETPEAKVVDFGTEFSVDVEEGASEVHVFEGLVRVQPRTTREDAPLAMDLRTSQAVRIDNVRPDPIEIELSPDRFIRSFDEPELGYRDAVRRLSPSVYYGMPIRANGMQGDPPQYSGTVLVGEGEVDGKGTRGPYAAGFVGGAMRVLKRSIGRGAMVEMGPPLKTGRFSLVALVYAESHRADATVIRNMVDDEGNFSLVVDEAGRPQVTVRMSDGALVSCKGTRALELEAWYQVVATADGERLRLFVDGKLVAETKCADLRPVDVGSYWFGTTGKGDGLWDGRLDEIAIFDRGLNADDVAAVAAAAQIQRVARLENQAHRGEKQK